MMYIILFLLKLYNVIEILCFGENEMKIKKMFIYLYGKNISYNWLVFLVFDKFIICVF